MIDIYPLLNEFVQKAFINHCLFSAAARSTPPEGLMAEPVLPKRSRPLSPLALRPPKSDRRDKPSATETRRIRCCDFSGRNLVVCIDGTANQFSIKNTNVVELFSRLVKDHRQLAYYNSGIGTYAEPSFKSWSYIKQVIGHKLDMAIAWRFEKIVHAAYEWLSENYLPGDRIFLFGFSRGAYQVRVIAAMIETVGLLHKGNKNQIAFAYELYAATLEELQHPKDKTTTVDSPRQPCEEPRTTNVKTSTVVSPQQLCKEFKRSLSRSDPDVKVHFVGAWDTVSSVGIARTKSLPGTTTGMKNVCVFRHALALDELRVKFLPEYARGGAGPSSEDCDVKEVWFPGSHSDIGGGNTHNVTASNFGPALRWMTYEALSHGLFMKPHVGDWETTEPTPSLTGLWKFLEILPFRTLSYHDESSMTRVPHLSSPRIMKQGQLIHASVVDLIMRVPSYRPATHLPAHSSFENWADLASSWDSRPKTEAPSETLKGVVEDDPFSSATHAISLLRDACGTFNPNPKDSETLPDGNIEAFEASIDTILSFLNDELRQTSLAEVAEAHQTLLSALKLDYLKGLPKSPPHPGPTRVAGLTRALALLKPPESAHTKTSELRTWISRAHDSEIEEYGPIFQKVLRNFGNGRLGQRDFGSIIVSIEPQKDGLIRITTDKKCLTWNTSINATEVFHEVGSDTSIVWSDGTHAFSLDAGPDTIPSSITTTKLETKERFNFDIPTVSRLCVVRGSHDGSTLASGFSDGLIRLWNSDGAYPRQLEGHQDVVVAVAFSSDNSRLLSASFDETARIWSLAGGKAMTVFRGHDCGVLCVAWCPSEDLVGSGDTGGLILVWDVTGNTKYRIQAHSDWVRDLVFSSHGDLLASGGDDGKVLVWSYRTQQRLWDFQTEAWIYNVAFDSAPAGKPPTQLFSVAREGSICIWDVEMNPHAIRPSSYPSVITAAVGDAPFTPLDAVVEEDHGELVQSG